MSVFMTYVDFIDAAVAEVKKQANGFTLPEDEKAEWVEALRSGKYKQGKGCLVTRYESENAFCCLGVKQAIHGVPGITTDGNDETFLAPGVPKSLPRSVQDVFSSLNDVAYLRIDIPGIGLSGITLVKDACEGITRTPNFDFEDIATVIERAL